MKKEELDGPGGLSERAEQTIRVHVGVRRATAADVRALAERKRIITVEQAAETGTEKSAIVFATTNRIHLRMSA